MTTFDLTPLLRSTIGFDRMTRMLESGMTPENSGGYPPYNIIKMSPKMNLKLQQKKMFFWLKAVRYKNNMMKITAFFIEGLHSEALSAISNWQITSVLRMQN